MLMKYDKILGTHDLILHDYGPGRCVASVHAEVPADGDILELHEMIDQAEREISTELNIPICIHMDPIVSGDPETDRVAAQLNDYLKGRDEGLMLHDLRRVPGAKQINLVFDVVVPAGEKFYFNDFCAPYTKGNGYELGPIVNYVSDKKLGYGGGICQVSTTLYDAILQIPIEVIKQQVHSAYGISYVPLDMDAAVGAGNIDLRLRNTLPYDVRFALQAVGGVLTVRVYRAS